jgi:hypothetical protein
MAEHTFHNFGCARCGWRWWTVDDEPPPTHRHALMEIGFRAEGDNAQAFAKPTDDSDKS